MDQAGDPRLLNPLVPTPKPPPLQISDYTSSSPSPCSSSSSSSITYSASSTTLILSDARHRIQALLSPSALSSHSTPLSLLRGAIITLTRYHLSYTLSPSAMAPSGPLQPGDEFVLQVEAFDVVGKGGSGEVGHPRDVMQDSEVRNALQHIKQIDVEPRRAIVRQHAKSLFPSLPPVLSLPSLPLPDAMPPPALRAISAELALHTPLTVSGYLHQFHVPAQSQAVLDAMPPFGPEQPEEVEEVDLAHSQWSSSKEEEERAVFSQYRPLQQREGRPSSSSAQPLVSSAASASASHAAPTTTAVLSSFSPPSLPVALVPHLSPASASLVAPSLPRLLAPPVDAAPLPALSQGEPLSPMQDDIGFYSTQAPLSFISPPLSPSSISSPSLEREDEGEAKAEREEASPLLPLSQHNLPLSTFDVTALHEEAEAEPQQGMDDDEKQKQAEDSNDAPRLSAAVHGHDEESEVEGGDDGSLVEVEQNVPAAADSLYLTQAPMMTEEQSQEPSSPPLPPHRSQVSLHQPDSHVLSSSSESSSRGLSLSLPLPSYPSSMPPLSPGTPSPQRSPQPTRQSAERKEEPAEPLRAAHAAPNGHREHADHHLRAGEQQLPQKERSEEKGVAVEEGKEGDGGMEDVGATLFTAESIRQRQHQRHRQLLDERRDAQRSSSSVYRARPPSPSRSTVDEDEEDGRGGAGQRKRQRVVRFADLQSSQPQREVESKEEVREEGQEGAAVAQSTLTQLTLTDADVQRLRREPRATHAPWSEADYDFVLSYWRSCTTAAADGAGKQSTSLRVVG